MTPNMVGVDALVTSKFLNTQYHCLVESGESIASEGKGDYMYVYGKVVDTKGRPVASAMIDTWETDDSGQYDTQVCRSDFH